jgi:hypothetical protein
MTKETIDHFTDNLSLVVDLIEATLKARPLFSAAVKKADSRRVFEATVDRFVGLGAVRYLPQLIKLGDEISETLQTEIDRYNEVVLKRLLEDKTFGYLYKGVTDMLGRKCIGILVDSSPMDEARCDSLVEKIAEVAIAIESEFDFSQQIGPIVVSNIKEAQKKMKNEAERIQSERGLIRKLPIFGSVYNWWSPVQTEIPGSSFDIFATTLSPPKIQKRPKPPKSSSTVPSDSSLGQTSDLTSST